ncbi:hypothetical protein [Streptococcus equinus]|nr:hypothetical protein [Streptococcus equinus]
MIDYNEMSVETYVTERLEKAIDTYSKKQNSIVHGLLYLRLFKSLHLP